MRRRRRNNIPVFQNRGMDSANELQNRPAGHGGRQWGFKAELEAEKMQRSRVAQNQVKIGGLNGAVEVPGDSLHELD